MEVDMSLAIAGSVILAALGASIILDGLRSRHKQISAIDKNWNKLIVEAE